MGINTMVVPYPAYQNDLGATKSEMYPVCILSFSSCAGLMCIMKRYFDKNNSRFNGQDTNTASREILGG
jgi:hypothetical protein